MREIALQTFAWGKPGSVLIQMMLIAVVGWLLNYLASAANNGRVANMISALVTFICIGLVATTAFNAIQTVLAIALPK